MRARPAEKQDIPIRIRDFEAAQPIRGIGNWEGDDALLRDECAEVIAAFFRSGGRMIDSSPMYGSSQPVIGHGFEALGQPDALFPQTRSGRPL